MRAAVVERYGPPDVVRVIEVPAPAPGRGEVLVRVEAVAVSAGDARLRAGRFPRGFGAPARVAVGLRGPRRAILGSAISGTVEQLGPDVEGLRVGDRVSGMNGTRLGGHAELVAMRARRLVPTPATVDHDAAAGSLFGGTTALHFLRDRVTPGASVLINGASGAVGTSAVQLAARAGGTVTAVTSARNADLVTRLGAQHVLDYTSTPLRSVQHRFDVVLDAVGTLTSATGPHLLTDRGVLLLVAADLADTVRARGRVVAGPAPENPADVRLLLDLLAAGQLDPVTETVGGLDTVQEAHRRIDGGHKVGNLVIEPNR
ncbi:NAD(P)-dependent alcohol dehydrogenase [Cellulomonas soli]|uniref:NAD(P)-dependent alcohol dehydrogenase n=1 Tax=Cellulomonas soli TaxID=931535 RepID=UPI003F83C032